MNKYFYCYSWPLKEFFIEHGQTIVMSSKNTNTQKTFWVFENNQIITELLAEWRLRKS